MDDMKPPARDDIASGHWSLLSFLMGVLPWGFYVVEVFSPERMDLSHGLVLSMLVLSPSFFVAGAHRARREKGRLAGVARWLNLIGLAACLGVIAHFLLSLR